MSLAVVALGMATQGAEAQIYYYPGRPVVAAPVVVPMGGVTTAYYAAPAYATPVYAAPAYAAPVYAASPVVQMSYSTPAYAAPTVFAAPVVAAPVVQTVRGGPFNYTVRSYGPGQYSRVHVHTGLFGGTVVRERYR